MIISSNIIIVKITLAEIILVDIISFVKGFSGLEKDSKTELNEIVGSRVCSIGSQVRCSGCLSVIKPACEQRALPFPALPRVCGIVSDAVSPPARGVPPFRRPYRYQEASLGAWGSGCESDSRWGD